MIQCKWKVYEWKVRKITLRLKLWCFRLEKLTLFDLSGGKFRWEIPPILGDFPTPLALPQGTLGVAAEADLRTVEWATAFSCFGGTEPKLSFNYSCFYMLYMLLYDSIFFRSYSIWQDIQKEMENQWQNQLGNLQMVDVPHLNLEDTTSLVFHHLWSLNHRSSALPHSWGLYHLRSCAFLDQSPSIQNWGGCKPIHHQGING